MKQVSGNAEQLARNCRDTAKLMGDVGVSMEGTKRKDIHPYSSGSKIQHIKPAHSASIFDKPSNLTLT